MAVAVLALAAYAAFPTFPTYDSFWALIWGSELLHGHLPRLAVYRAPTEHPLAIAFGAFCSIFGPGGARLMVIGALASFVALLAGVYRFGASAFGEFVGWVAAALMLSRFYDINLAVQGYLDISYLALIVWAGALEAARARRGAPVLWLLAAAGLLRPDAWVLAGLYWLWWAWPSLRARVISGALGRSLAPGERQALALLALALAAPLAWFAFDALLTGNPLHSMQATAELAGELERSHGAGQALASIWPFAVRIDKAPVLYGALAGIPLALWLVPRRAALPLAMLLAQLLVFIAEGAAGASLINRYLLGASVLALFFCAFALGGFSLLRRSVARSGWLLAALALLAYGAANVLGNFHVSELPTTMAYHEDFHAGLQRLLSTGAVRGALRRCPLLSLPDNKLLPDALWILGGDTRVAVVARSQASGQAAQGNTGLQRQLASGSIAVYPLGAAVFFEALVDPGDRALDQVPPPGFRRIYSSRLYAVYANC